MYKAILVYAPKMEKGKQTIVNEYWVVNVDTSTVQSVWTKMEDARLTASKLNAWNKFGI